jgi:hypothetical protein
VRLRRRASVVTCRDCLGSCPGAGGTTQRKAKPGHRPQGWHCFHRGQLILGGDFTRWKEHDAYKEALERLLRDLKVGVKPGADG